MEDYSTSQGSAKNGITSLNNALLILPVFTTVSNKSKNLETKTEIAIGNYKISLDGARLNNDVDLMLFLNIINKMSRGRLDRNVEFSFKELLVGLGYKSSEVRQATKNMVLDSARRLLKTVICIENTSNAWVSQFTMISKVVSDKKTFVEFSLLPETAHFFKSGFQRNINIKAILELSYFARSIYLYIQGKQNSTVDIEHCEFMTYLNERAYPKKYRKNLIQALDELKSARHILEYDISDSSVTIAKKISKKQVAISKKQAAMIHAKKIKVELEDKKINDEVNEEVFDIDPSHYSDLNPYSVE